MSEQGKREQIKAARKRLKKHVKTRGRDTEFVVTGTFCYYWWYRLNFSIFDGILTPPVRFELRNFRDNLGWCIPWRPNSKVPRVRIGINTDLFDRFEFLCVLSHEMVHQWEWEVLHDWEKYHDERFFSWRNKFKIRAGLPLEGSY